jgi:hypothetical protein
MDDVNQAIVEIAAVAIATAPASDPISGSVPAKKPRGFQKGNPGGRMKKSKASAETLRKAILDSATPRQAQIMADFLYRKGLDGDMQAAKLWLEYTVGKPVQSIDLKQVLTVLDPHIQSALIEDTSTDPQLPFGDSADQSDPIEITITEDNNGYVSA